MNIRTRAAVYTLAFFLVAVLASFVTHWLTETLPAYVFGYIGVAITFGLLLYAVYLVILSRLEYDNLYGKLKKDSE